MLIGPTIRRTLEPLEGGGEGQVSAVLLVGGGEVATPIEAEVAEEAVGAETQVLEEAAEETEILVVVVGEEGHQGADDARGAAGTVLDLRRFFTNVMNARKPFFGHENSWLDAS